MQPSSYQLPGLREQFQYYNDGRLQKMTDLDDRGQDAGYPDTARHFSRAHSYDQVGRLVSASGTPSQVSSLPYNQSYGYDAFGNATSRYGAYYYQSYSSDGGSFQNNRRQDFNYDADGNVMHTPSYNNMGTVVSFRDWTYDAAGQMTQVKETITANNSVSTYVSSHDGDEQPTIEYYQENLASKSFMVRSSVLGGKVLTRLDNAGNKSSTVFGVDGLLTAVQNVSPYGSSVRWTHIDPLGLSEAGDTKSVFDPTGNYIVWQQCPTGPPPNAYPPSAASFGGLGSSFGSAQDMSCVFNGQPISCTELQHQIDIGNVAAEILLGIQHVEVPLTPLGLGMFAVSDAPVWVPDHGKKKGHAGEGIDPDGIIRVNIDKEGKGHYERFLVAVEVEPQNPSPTSTPCKGSIPEAAGRAILAAVGNSGVDPTLLSVTWRHESAFGNNPPPNPRYEGRGRNRKLVGWDVGPLQLATNVWQKSPYIDDLGDPFGTIAMSEVTQKYVGFNGNVADNLTVGVRAFSISKSNADAAGLYRAGSRTGPGYQDRYDQYTREAPGDRAQLNCLTNRR